jgi:hypothetical protein
MKSGDVYFNSDVNSFIVLIKHIKERYYDDSFIALEIIDRKVVEVRLTYKYIEFYSEQLEEPMADLIRTLYL